MDDRPTKNCELNTRCVLTSVILYVSPCSDMDGQAMWVIEKLRYILIIKTFLRSSPWDIDSHIMKAETKCWTGPASPQWGRNTKVFKPLS